MLVIATIWLSQGESTAGMFDASTVAMALIIPLPFRIPVNTPAARIIETTSTALAA